MVFCSSIWYTCNQRKSTSIYFLIQGIMQFKQIGPCETELDAVNQISGIAELSKPKCVLEIYFVILLLGNNAS
jgi:hypothetical protein